MLSTIEFRKVDTPFTQDVVANQKQNIVEIDNVKDRLQEYKQELKRMQEISTKLSNALYSNSHAVRMQFERI